MLHAQDVTHVVLSDVHLWTEPAQDRVSAVAELMGRHPGVEVVFNGDTFDLSLDLGPEPRWAVFRQILSAQPVLLRALRKHFDTGGRVTFVAGNHDNELMLPEARHVLLEAVGVTAAAPLDTARWFIRRGPVHIEHGHLYDRDNAPFHPLALWNVSTEPLGVALMRRFVAANNAPQYAHANETTPVRGLMSAFRNFRARAPLVIARYMTTAAGLCIEAGPARKRAAEEQRATGNLRIAEYARETGVPEEALSAMLRAAPPPTHLRASETFMRLYFDRIFAGVAGALSMAALPSPPAVAAFLASAGYLTTSVVKSGGRYHGAAVAGLREGAESVARLTGAGTVIFGHTHVADSGPHYVNLGSFGFPVDPGRPYGEITRDGGVRRRILEGPA